LQLSFLYSKFGKKQISLAVIAWFLLALIAVLAELFHDSINNYLIFKNVFWHTIHQQNLYLEYPAEYQDSNHYGVLFSLVIAPFAVLPDWLGVILWVLLNAYVLYVAIKTLPVSEKSVNTILLISAIEMMTASHNVQFNAIVAAAIIFSYTLVKRQNECWSTFFIAAVFLIKLYGIAGLLFFVFSENRLKFIGWFLFWMVVLFALPMVISSPAYIVQCYRDWFQSLTEKNLHNISLDYINMQDISAMGMLRRTFQLKNMSNLVMILPAAILLALPLLRFNLYKHLKFQLAYVALCLLTVVIYSSSAESPTYVIAMVGIAIWFVISDQASTWNRILLVFAIVMTSLSATDLFPRVVKQTVILPYALKALPSFIIWLVLIIKVGLMKEERFKEQHQNEPNANFAV